MAYIHFITGGQRSGKSSYAQQRALEKTKQPIYLATSRRWDDDHEARIQRHKSDRGESWKTIEEEKYIGSVSLDGEVVVIDCVTLWLTNFFFDENNDIQKCLEAAKTEIDLLTQKDATFFIISNEIGMGGHAASEVQRKFTDLQGWVNQYIASVSDTVTLMVSGIPLQVK